MTYLSDICKNRRSDGPTPCYFPNCDCHGSIIAPGVNAHLYPVPKSSKWVCYITNSFRIQPLEGQEPNWFHRLMQRFILGFYWTKEG